MRLQTPEKIRTLQRKLYLKAKAEPDFRFYLLWPELDEENYLGRDSIDCSPAAPVHRIDADLQMNEARCERRRHAVGDAAIACAVAAGDQRRAFGQLVLAAFAVEHQLIKSGLDHRHGGGQFFQVDEPTAGIIRRRQEGGRRPAGAVGAVAPGDAAQVDGIEQQRADVDIFAAGGGRDLLGDVRFGTAGWAPDDHWLSGLDQQRQGLGKLARAQRVVGGDGIGVGHWELRTKGSRGRNVSRRSDPRPVPAWLSSSTCQGTNLQNGLSAPGVVRVSQLRRRCCLREETRGLEKPDDGSVVAKGSVKGAEAGTHCTRLGPGCGCGRPRRRSGRLAHRREGARRPPYTARRGRSCLRNGFRWAARATRRPAPRPRR